MAHQGEDAFAGVQVGQLLAHHRFTVAPSRAGEVEQRAERVAPHLLAAAAGTDGDAFVGQHRHRDPPPVVDVAHQCVGGEAHVVEEHLVEVSVPVDLPQWARGDAGDTHVDDEHADAAVLRNVGVRAGDEQPVVAVVRARRPHLLAVHHPLVAVAFRPRLQAGDVGPRAGLREQLAPHRVGPQESGQIRSLLRVGAELQQRRRAHPQPDHELP